MAMSKCKECGKSVSTLAKVCPKCGVPNPTKRTKSLKKKKNKKIISKAVTPNIKNYKKNKDKIWVHCRNYKCRDYTQMYQIYEDYLNIDSCNLCKSKFIEAKIENNKPIMPTDGVYGKSNNKTSVSSSSTSSSNYKSSSSSEKGVYDKFYDGSLDLATAFWLFGVVGSFAVGFIGALIAESVSLIFYIPSFGIQIGIIAGLYECANNYIKDKNKKKQGAVWGYLTQVYCGLGAIGLVATGYDIIKTL